MSDSSRLLKELLDGAGDQRIRVLAQITADTGFSKGTVERFLKGQSSVSTALTLERWIKEHSKDSTAKAAG